MKKILEKLLTGAKLAEYYEKNEDFIQAYRQYLKIGNVRKAGEILEKKDRWREVANLYINTNEIDSARRAIEHCFRRNESWESFDLDDGQKISIESWLKQKNQTRRFVRYVKEVDVLDNKGVPLIVILANKLKHVLEFKSAAELYLKGFTMVNKDKSCKSIKNEVWLRYAAECYTKIKLYKEAAAALKELIVTEVNIGEAFTQNGINPYRNYTINLKLARDWNFLPQLLEIMEDFDPFNMAYDLLKIGEPLMSMRVFFKYYGTVLKRELNDKEREIRNEKILYCMNQYIIYYRNRKDYAKAAEIALLNSQTDMASELFKKAEQEEEKNKAGAAETLKLENVKNTEESREPQAASSSSPTPARPKETLKCSTCGENIEPDWEICPSCENVLNLDVCVCGQKIKPHWKRCPACQRILGTPLMSKTEFSEDTKDGDTKPFSFIKPDLE